MIADKPSVGQRFLDDYTAVVRRYSELRSLEARRLIAGRVVQVPCTFCGSAVADFAFARDGFQFKVCASCESIFASPRPPRAILEARRTESAAGEFWRSEVRPRLRILRDTAEENLPLVLDALRRESLGTNLLAIDVGCGDGALLRKLVDLPQVATVSGIETDGALAAEARGLGFHVVVTTVERAEMSGAGLVTTFDLVEHCYDPVGFLAGCGRLLGPAGLLLVTAPNAGSFATTTLWERSPNIFPPDHINLPTVTGLTRAIERAGLQVVDATTVGDHEIQTLRSVIRSDATVPLLRPVRSLLKLSPEMAANFEEILKASGMGGRVFVIAQDAESRKRLPKLN